MSVQTDRAILTAIGVLWLAWLLFWYLSARGTKTIQWREPRASAARHRIPILIASLLFAAPDLVPPALHRRWLAAQPGTSIAGLVLVAAGLGFTIWARLHLGANWSGSVTVKHGHSLTRTGPYRFVRHPIYTGLLVAFAGMALAVGEWRGLVALPIAFVALWRKSRVEEGRMRETFPEYAEYSRRTAALIPLVF